MLTLYFKPFISRRLYSSLSPNYNAIILKFIEENKATSTSTVFQGTLYEYTVMRELSNKLLMKDLNKIGGAGDKGIDIVGSWPIYPIYEKMNPIFKLSEDKILKRTKINGAFVKPLRNKLEEENANMKPINIAVQCKAFRTSKVSPRDLRELVGTYTSLFANPSGKYNKAPIIIFMCSPNLLTKDGINLINSVSIPLIYLRVNMIPSLGNQYIYNETTLQEQGHIVNYYENLHASKLLQSCGIKEWLNLRAYD
ncbi:hypothetical protein TBLA_0B02860 [Henningerozyma blattae CBS 6284]|uniref:Required for respiratory growth protein 7, mitochondrial n=1 Tax=Henningerozyma blattae (strain ATCC 34711 / CBS 6284 / DSM 70876 / NBRC 10599 / NRRL Y-10934 / UCD 77-7) TaxID=1071380 RepID=I2GYC6_HENB6|nr:hypothetical protein TBLA_0B02860 [Tetrapisispora blattae CBS 6284]CCH59128.1 hypothetical protein TBLA_0B02860 [Tetrapisispora blattae CBS 6284]